jgi:hypothetical protein
MEMLMEVIPPAPEKVVQGLFFDNEFRNNIEIKLKIRKKIF